MTRITAEGVCRLRFHGEFSTTAIIGFKTPEDAKLAHKQLPSWEPLKDLYLVRHAPDEDVFRPELEKLGLKVKCGHYSCRHQCVKSTLTNPSHSIDFGPNWTLDFEVERESEGPQPTQLPLL